MLSNYVCSLHDPLTSEPSAHCNCCEQAIILPKTVQLRKINCRGMSEKSSVTKDPIYAGPV
jgi:hypothetical protein